MAATDDLKQRLQDAYRTLDGRVHQRIVGLDEVIERMRSGPLPDAAQALRNLARGRMEEPEGLLGKPDDLTFLLFRQ